MDYREQKRIVPDILILITIHEAPGKVIILQ